MISGPEICNLFSLLCLQPLVRRPPSMPCSGHSSPADSEHAAAGAQWRTLWRMQAVKLISLRLMLSEHMYQLHVTSIRAHAGQSNTVFL